MGRIHPLATRVGSLINWPQDVRHPPLSKFVKQIFQTKTISKPFVKASVNSIWIDVSVYEKNILDQYLGQIEKKTEWILNNDKHYKNIKEIKSENNELGRNLPGYMFKKRENVNNYKLFNIQDERPIYLRITPIYSPYLNAQIAAHHTADKISQRSPPKAILNDIRRFASVSIHE